MAQLHAYGFIVPVSSAVSIAITTIAHDMDRALELANGHLQAKDQVHEIIPPAHAPEHKAEGIRELRFLVNAPIVTGDDYQFFDGDHVVKSAF